MEPKHDTLNLSVEQGSWMVDHRGPQRARIVELFGTSKLPTAFTSTARELHVISELARLNPGMDIFGPTLMIVR